ncbi:301202b4-6c7b-4128-8029-eb6ef9b408b1 [Sclerotinia trifoliorum]|uniref:301202b4-6c7b-4128-8029-eb6ef9b408b1 n=1 Tax=Sclerotinia trifoliorum TaxID=28548 RepID=A0A8H2VZF6_9HELO|nr:301202b4-6c7b-4128-8029-eb6ef9b408b1 [Sclerotinia trifoliorum]
MRTTIEPRLMSFLNNNNDSPESLPNSPSLGLPTLHDRNILQTTPRLLLLERNTGTRSGGSSSQASQHSSSVTSIDDNETNYRDAEEVLRIGNVSSGNEIGAMERTLGASSPQSLRKILDDNNGNNNGNTRTANPKKQQRRENGNDDFVQLPRPHKKQRSNKQVVPPIIIGLHEPPPQAALFPPIASSSFHDSHGRNSLNALAPKATGTQEDFKTDDGITEAIEETLVQNGNKKKRRKSVKARNKWSEDETNNLLLGVHKYGVGKWMEILEDPSFAFNNRSGVDLKDRFRTCCPDELRGESHKSRSRKTGSKSNNIADQSRTEMVTLDSPPDSNLPGQDQEADGTVPDSAFPPLLRPSRKRRNHRKRLTDLQKLGIQGPFKQSERRERRPFSNQEDLEIEEGYRLYGPAWTRMQRDPQFNLQSRQPIDLRDRFRNIHPDLFRIEEDDDDRIASQSKPAQIDDFSYASNNTTTIDPATFSLNNEISKHTMEPTDSLAFSQSFDWTDNIAAPPFPNIGEMDISRLLEHHSWTP